MANFHGLGEILKGVSRNVLTSAFNAATSTRATDAHTVHEITGKSNLDDVSSYPISQRAGNILLYGPIPPGRFFSKPSPYNIILHVPNCSRMFILYRTDSEDDAKQMFILYRESFQLLVECDPSICDWDRLERMTKKLRENQGWTAPHLAAALGLVISLRHDKLKDKLNEQEGIGLKTPLLVAIDNDNIPAVIALLELGADVTIKDIKENTIFHLAAGKSPQLFQVLADKVPLSHRELLNHLNAEGFTPLHSACKNNNSELVKLLLSAGADVNVSSATQGYPIHSAIKARSVCSLQELIRQNPSMLSMKDLQDGGSPLHWATGPETLIPLLDLGCDPNMMDEKGATPLHNAVNRGCLRSTLYLLCHGAFPDIKGQENDETPLHVAARLCSWNVMKALIVFGSDINLTNKHGQTPRHLVCTSQRSDMDETLFILSAVGAKRCHPSQQNYCVDGCKSSGSFDGVAPSGFIKQDSPSLMNDLLNAFSLQKGAQDKSAQPMDCDNNGAPSEAHLGGRLLCLDGGGIRGIILTQMLVVMQQEFGVPVMKVFDWVAGTSTGGILALALACGKTPLETQCIYLRLKDKVFIGERPYSAKVMEDFLKQEFGDHKTMGSIHRPRVMIMTALVDRRPADLHIFRNYLSPCSMVGEPEPITQDPEGQFVWEVAKVTGAAPSYFRLDHPQFVDGGLIANNPTLDALTELVHFTNVMKSLGNFSNDIRVPMTVVSLGTGIPPRTDSNASLLDITWPSGVLDAITKVPRLASLVNLLIDQATQSEGQVVERSRAWCSSIGVPFYRFSPKMSTGIELDERDDEKLINLLWETRCYMMANRESIINMKTVLFDKVHEL